MKGCHYGVQHRWQPLHSFFSKHPFTFLIMKTKFWYLLILGFLSFGVVATSCSDDEEEIVQPTPPDEPDNPDKPDVPKPPVINVTVTMKEATVEGTVTDVSGLPLPGVNISSGEVQTTTDDKGWFTFERIASANGRFVFTFKKDGYFTVTRSGAFKDNLSLQVVMQGKNSGDNVVSTSFTATQENTLKADGMEVVIPASALVTASGEDYTGTVKADMLYLSPDNENFTTMMPGSDMAAIRTDRSEATLISYGMVEVSLTDGSGNPLQLKEGNQSEMTYPIPESMKDNPPPTIPLWYFNEEAGVWVEEGVATLKGDVYVGSVSHFSWHNLDVAEERVTIKGKVTDCQGRPVSRVLVTVDQTSDITISDGSYSVYVPANTPVTVTVKSEDYYSYSPVASVPVAGQPGGTTVDDINLELPCTPVVSGRIINSCGELTVASIWCEYTLNGKTYTTIPVWTDITTGNFTFRLPSGATGKGIIHVQPVGGNEITKEVTLTGGDLTVNVELCQDIETVENVLTISKPTGEVIRAYTIDASKAIFGVSEGALAYIAPMVESGSFVLGIENYSDDVKTYEDATAALYANSETDPYGFASEKAHVDILSRTDSNIKLSISATGQYFDMNGTEEQAFLTGTVSGEFSVSSDYRTNVTDWSSLACAKAIPQLLLPIDLVAVITVPMLGEVEALYYNGSVAEVDRISKILTDAGFSLMSEEGDGKNTITRSYMDDNWSMISINFDTSGNQAPDGKSYPIMVVPLV